ncbi:cytochrome c biogenesis protein [Acaryochloris sp. CCMEE 5410]|uniref:cytochrome c biogenesis protein n=1 Tax=Acaryochloris sp. CCMEE 5410 TaxID=310037 RepID=UPI0002484756|nr:cytochrome c biogenesis protein [Acaryochloris sp. CCMEE 5410]KAI9131515.1 cytochrome c biogenesis protein [Acaryochloris sp. CCMEE 5410]
MTSNLGQPQAFFKKTLVPVLADLRLAIVLLLAIALFSISGTVIEQGQSLEFYQANYPEDPALFGFLTWKVLVTIGLDHVYATWWFLSLLILFGTSLTACTFMRQLPALKAARSWKFYKKPRQFGKLALSTTLDPDQKSSLLKALVKNRYKVFEEDQSIYARKGMTGRIGPIIVHASMILILLGSIWGSLTGFMAQEMIPSGTTAKVSNIVKSGPWSGAQIPKDWAVQVNRFWIDYTPEGQIDQFYSDLSIVDEEKNELDRQTIHVNQPLKHKGVTLYQADWSIAGVRVQLNNSPILQLPMAPLEAAGGRIWGTWVPTKPDLSAGVTLLTTDLQGTVVVYDESGKLVSTVRTGMSTDVNDISLKLVELVGSTGLQIKSDPGIPWIYAGFGLLMIGVIMSYVSHSQIWLLTADDQLYVGGRTNRALLTFERELVEMIESSASDVPSPTTQPQPQEVA